MATTLTFTETVTLVRKVCGKCGITFAVPKAFEDECLKDGAASVGWYCPNGHGRVYCESTAAKLERQLQRERQRRDQAEADADHWRERQAETERSLSATRGVVTRFKNRVGNGVCPCCTRSFKNLHRHMVAKHPTYVEKFNAK